MSCRKASQASAVLVATIASTGALADPASAGAWYVGIGVADVKGSANATGNFVESEWDHSAAARIALGYEASLTPLWSLRGELYGLPQKTALGLGDQARNTWGLAVLPTFAVRADTKLFMGLGYERAQTNSPVSNWRSFGVDTPVLGAGANYSLESLLKAPLSLTARYEWAQYKKIDFQGQVDRMRQERLTFSIDYRF